MKIDSWTRGIFTVFLLIQVVPLEDPGIFQITRDMAKQETPAIYDNIVVWTDWRNVKVFSSFNLDIYGYDLLTRKEFRITEDKKYRNFLQSMGIL